MISILLSPLPSRAQMCCVALLRIWPIDSVLRMDLGYLIETGIKDRYSCSRLVMVLAYLLSAQSLTRFFLGCFSSCGMSFIDCWYSSNSRKLSNPHRWDIIVSKILLFFIFFLFRGARIFTVLLYR
ncbi:hypothetical protein GGS21DRAFT_144640 [Xylaria nigripes]|nr:hypothetical protein GGS21DRAFT_144640 [Xylaria nigripes]